MSSFSIIYENEEEDDFTDDEDCFADDEDCFFEEEDWFVDEDDFAVDEELVFEDDEDLPIDEELFPLEDDDSVESFSLSWDEDGFSLPQDVNRNKTINAYNAHLMNSNSFLINS